MNDGMRAWQIEALGAPGDVLRQSVARSVPQPGPGEVLLGVRAAGIGLPDVMMCRGTYAFEPQRPFVPGQEVVGVVQAAGEGSRHAVGQRLMGVTAFYAGNGGFADYCIAPDYSLYPAPDALPDSEAAAFCIPYHTAWVGLRLRAQIRPGEVLLVLGAAGGTGAAAVRLGVALGARVIAVAGGQEKGDYCLAAGAETCVDYREAPVVQRVLELTDGRGADVVYDPVGGDLFEQTVACTASGGRLLAVGYASGRWGLANAQQLVVRNCAVLGVFVGAHDHSELLQGHQQLCELHETGAISAAPERVVSFDDIGATVAALERREFPGKAVAQWHS